MGDQLRNFPSLRNPTFPFFQGLTTFPSVASSNTQCERSLPV